MENIVKHIIIVLFFLFQIILLSKTVYNYFGKKTIYEKQIFYFLCFVGALICSLNYHTLFKLSHLIDFVDNFNLFQNFVSLNLILFFFIAILFVVLQKLINTYLQKIESLFFNTIKQKILFTTSLIVITVLFCFFYEYFIIKNIENALFYNVDSSFINKGL